MKAESAEGRPSFQARSSRSANIAKPCRATSSISSSRPRKCRYGAAALTPAARAASTSVKPNGPRSSISVSVAATRAWRRLPW